MLPQQDSSTRRRFLKTTASLTAVGGMAPYWFTSDLSANEPSQAANDRPTMGCIGVGDRWMSALRHQIHSWADILAVCDVDTQHMEQAQAACKKSTGKTPEANEDYRHLLDRKDIDVVSIATPDHWHTKIAIEAMQSGKDVYCEKPVTLTIDEGKKLCQVTKETGRVFQVGSQQRTEMKQVFLQAIALVRAGRIGELRRTHVAIGPAPSSGPIPVVDPPKHLNWEKWLGQAPLAEYRYLADGNKFGQSRGHFEFRWWYEYSGGKMTDWGAHHVDIAQWAMGMDESGPTSVEVLSVNHPVPLEKGMPTLDDRYNVASQFSLRCEFPGDLEMFIADAIQTESGANFGNGILLEGTKGRLFVNRSRITGKPVEELADNPLPEEAIRNVYRGKNPSTHMANFFDCVKTRDLPISDIFSHHRVATTCHLSNIALRLGRNLNWDPATEQIVGDDEANAWQSREQRKGYEIRV